MPGSSTRADFFLIGQTLPGLCYVEQHVSLFFALYARSGLQALLRVMPLLVRLARHDQTLGAAADQREPLGRGPSATSRGPPDSYSGSRSAVDLLSGSGRGGSFYRAPNS
jgi:hypothetical protein